MSSTPGCLVQCLHLKQEQGFVNTARQAGLDRKPDLKMGPAHSTPVTELAPQTAARSRRNSTVDLLERLHDWKLKGTWFLVLDSRPQPGRSSSWSISRVICACSKSDMTRGKSLALGAQHGHASKTDAAMRRLIYPTGYLCVRHSCFVIIQHCTSRIRSESQ